MPGVKEAVADLVTALLGISTHSPPMIPGPQLGDEAVSEAQKALGGRLEPIPEVRLRWYPPDIERAQLRSSTGDLTLIGQLNESMKLDGTLRGLRDARASVVALPKRFYGREDIIEVLLSKNASDRNVYEEMVPTSESKLMVDDEIVCGVSVGTMVPVKGRDFPVLVRRYPQNLWYFWSRNTWYYRSIVGLLPITPGVPNANGETWILHMGGGRLSPWNNGLWNCLGRAYINKTQTVFARQSYEMKHSHPARVATAALGATDEERKGMLASIIRWALNAAFALPIGWDIKLVESNGRGIEIYDKSIAHYNEEMATALCGSSVMLQGTVGFGNIDPFRYVQKDLIRTTSANWDHTVNTQILPGFIGSRWGVEALYDATTIETDITEPKDREKEATTLTAVGTAVKALVEAIAAAQRATGDTEKTIALDIREVLARFGIPTVDGAPLPKVAPGEGGDVDGSSPAALMRALSPFVKWSSPRGDPGPVPPAR